MASLAILLYPQRVGISRVKSPGNSPSFSTPQWKTVDNVTQLLDEPLMLASLIREMVGDEDRYDVYLNVWPGAYSAVMFSYDRKHKGDLKRLRQSELETVFHGEFNKMYTHDLLLDKDRPSANGKSRRIIFAIPRERVSLLKESFAAQKMKLQRIAPMDVAAAESAVQFWAPRDKSISVCMMLDEACTSISFMREGVLHAIRTIPNGFGSVLSSYMTITNLEIDECLDMIRSNGVHVPDERFDMPAIQDDVLRTLNRLTGEVVKTLHSTFGDEAVIDHVLLCGNFTRTVGLVEYLNTMLDTECAIAGADTLKSGAASAIVLNEADLEAMFPLAATTAKGADLMSELKKHKADKVKSIALCSLMTVAVAGMMIVTPVTKNNLQKERDASAALMSQPEYMAVQELFDTKTELNRYKSDLAEAIEALPHGQTASASIVGDLVKITTDYGTVLALSTDYNAKTISLSFTTLNYDSFVYWQKQIAEGGRFSFLEPPTFSGNGLIFTVEANMTATDFDMTKPEAEVPEETTAETAEAPEETTAETTEGMG